MAKPKYQYDVFISHAVEDKIPVANELDKALRKRGLEVWYSGKELSIGDELTETIHEGLDQSRFGVVIISPTYLQKVWALGEYFRLKQRRGKAVLPVFYDITPAEIGKRYPPMADLVGVSMSAGMDVVVEKLYRVIKGDPPPESNWLERIRKYVHDQGVRLTVLMTMLLVLGGVASYALLSGMGQRPSNDHIDKEVAARIASLQRNADQRVHDFADVFKRKPAVAAMAAALYQRFSNTKSYYRNEYQLILPGREIRGRRNVEMALHQPMQEFTPTNGYQMAAAQVYLDSASYMYYNTNPISYTTTRVGYKDDHYDVTVTYAEGVRLVYTTLYFPTSEKDTKRHHVTIDALPPTETYSFVQKGDVWELQEIR
jgi:hypothetical protein